MGHYNGKHGKGYSKKVKEIKKAEADARNKWTNRHGKGPKPKDKNYHVDIPESEYE